MEKRNRKFYENYLINYYTKVNKPKGISVKDISINIKNNQLMDLVDEYRLIQASLKKFRTKNKKVFK